MKKIKFLGMAVMAMLALTATLTTTASAEELPNILPAGTPANTILATFTSGTSSFGATGIEEVTSSSDVGTIDSTSTKLGFFAALFLGVKTVLSSCLGLGDTVAGSVLVKGTFHIRAFKEKGTLLTAAIFLLQEVHFTCGTILVLVKGCVAGAITPENVSTKTLTVTLARNGNSNDNLIITVLNEANTAEEACQLLGNKNSGAFELSTEVTEEKISGFKEDRSGGGTNIAVEVMRL